MRLFRDQEYYRCDYCGSYYFPDPSKDGVRVLGVAPEAVQCPVCAEPLHLAALDNQYRGYQCPRCLGLLLQGGAFSRVMTARRAWATRPPDAPRPLDRDQLARQIRCPMCHQPMSTHAYAGPGTIVIDNCDQCFVVWLDYGELARVVNAPGRDRGSALLQKEQLVQVLSDLLADAEPGFHPEA
jgi:Zn-finger nucleic acid-binding protein